MKTDPEIMKIKALLEKVKAPHHWSEITGPFFHLKLPETSASGPYTQAGLKELTEANIFPENTQVRDAKNIGEWINIYSHPAFQRRRPQIIADEKELPENRDAYILVDGQKHGPLSSSEIKALLNQKEILLTDQVSFDDGHTWRKLYEYAQFDRRDLEQGHLPSIPGWDVFKGSNDEIDEQLGSAEQRERQLNAFAGLAFIENVESHQNSQTNQQDSESSVSEKEHHEGADIVEFVHPNQNKNHPQDNNSEESGWTKNLAYVVAICIMLGASAYMLFNDPMQEVNLLTDRDKAARKLIKRGTPTNGRVPASEKAVVQRAQEQEKKYKVNRVNKIRKAPRRAPSRRPASITDTDSFREGRKMQERPFRDNEDPYQDDPYGGEDYAYDDGSTPVAQDRVRKRLDKRTIDSEDQYYDKAQQDDFMESDIDSVEGVWGSEDGRVPQSDDAYQEESYQEDSYQDEGGYDDQVQQGDVALPQESYPAEENYQEESYQEESYKEESYPEESYSEEAYGDEPQMDEGY